MTCRAKQLERILSKQVQTIQIAKPNENSYPAFVGIRWGFARVEVEVLAPTDQWHQQHCQDPQDYYPPK